MAAAEPARILPLPGTLNHKYDPPRPVVLELLTEHLYNTADLAVLYPALEEMGPDGEPAPDTTTKAAIKHDIDRATRLEMARSWVSVQRPAIEGVHGDDHNLNNRMRRAALRLRMELVVPSATLCCQSRDCGQTGPSYSSQAAPVS
jgi:hypothetical protein